MHDEESQAVAGWTMDIARAAAVGDMGRVKQVWADVVQRRSTVHLFALARGLAEMAGLHPDVRSGRLAATCPCDRCPPLTVAVERHHDSSGAPYLGLAVWGHRGRRVDPDTLRAGSSTVEDVAIAARFMVASLNDDQPQCVALFGAAAEQTAGDGEDAGDLLRSLLGGLSLLAGATWAHIQQAGAR